MTTPAPAVAISGITASGQTLQFSLPGSGIQVTAAFGAVSGTSPSLQAFADCLVGVNWVQVVELTALTAAGFEQGVGRAPVSGPPGSQQWRLRWTVSGTNPLFLGSLHAQGV